MSLDVADLAAFYDGPLGRQVGAQLGRAVRGLWPEIRGRRVLGLGFATPFLPIQAEGGALSSLAVMPAALGVTAWPASGLRAVCLADLLMLPFPDETADRILVVHALETAESPGELLHEVARLLAPEGRAILVCPNRRGLWARMDATPFGYGQPFSRKQLRRLMRCTNLAAESWAEALYWPPVPNRLLLSSAAALERVGASLKLPFAGVHVVEVVKQLHRPVMVRERRRLTRPWRAMAPVPASRTALGAPPPR